MSRLRWWLIRKLAGKDSVVINAALHDGAFVLCGDKGATNTTTSNIVLPYRTTTT